MFMKAFPVVEGLFKGRKARALKVVKKGPPLITPGPREITGKGPDRGHQERPDTKVLTKAGLSTLMAFVVP